MAAAAEQGGDKPKKPFPVKMLMTALLLVANLGTVGGGLYLTYAATLGFVPPQVREAELQQIRKLASEAQEATPEEPLIYTMDKITVNLNGEPKRMVRIEVNVELLNPIGFSEIMENDRRAKVRDSVTDLLGRQSFTDIESIQGKLFLKDRIASDLNSILDQGIVKAVYFSEFVVQ
ncbi:MAG: flagellar basal body-associated FliL family protein [Bdellovibrionaceae bacterium]|nr:flagellar basal body-associated FliL family protein [Pseudobdellovibrionaceae bacterium]